MIVSIAPDNNDVDMQDQEGYAPVPPHDKGSRLRYFVNRFPKNVESSDSLLESVWIWWGRFKIQISLFHQRTKPRLVLGP